MADPIVIERVRGISGTALYRDFVEPKRPVIIEDACAHWNALREWTLEGLRERFGDRVFKEYGYDDRAINIGERLDAIGRSTPQAPAPYLRGCYLGITMPELLDDVKAIPGEEHNRLRGPGLPGGWRPPGYREGSEELLVAGRGTSFPVLHYDIWCLHAFITQIRGNKTFWIYRPDQGRHLYPRKDIPWYSGIDRFDPVDLERWPEYAKAESVSIEVRPGETIFVPSGFWHRTHTSDISIAITWNAVTGCNWQDFIQSYYFQPGQPRLKAAAKRLYFAALGLVMRTRDAV